MIRARAQVAEILGDEPVSLSEAKKHLRVDTNYENSLISAQIQAARDYAEGVQDRALVQARYFGWLDQIPTGPVELPRADLESIVAVHLIDRSGAEIEVPSSAYVADTTVRPGALIPRPGWPSVTLRESGGVRITYIAGPGPLGVSERVKAAIKLLVGDLYENREETIIGSVVETSSVAVRALLGLDRLWRA